MMPLPRLLAALATAALTATSAMAGDARDALSAETAWQRGASTLGLARGTVLERAPSPGLLPIERDIAEQARRADIDCRDRPAIAIGFEAPDPGGVSNPHAFGLHRDFVLMTESLGAINAYAQRGVAAIACR